MKKVVYSVTRYRRDDIDKISGLGYITDTDLVIACMSKAGKPYIRVFEDCVKNCLPMADPISVRSLMGSISQRPKRSLK